MRYKSGFTIYELIFILVVVAVGIYLLSLAISNAIARARVEDFVQTAESIDRAVRTYILKERPIGIEVATLNLERLERLNYLPDQGENIILRVVDLKDGVWIYYRPVGSREYPEGNPSVLVAFKGKLNARFEKYFRRWAQENGLKIYYGQISLPGFTDQVLRFQEPSYRGNAAVIFFPLR
ncbi:MAG: hypothetical protein PWP37_735 [Thermotogota bacterium]|nr:hypothetical protein [Thermotogota bacterium]MDK2864543.1 hypothetical protein [Thermotogota bacterium]HCZ06190.1 hypothetical protein [Thermotogota bacterium]